MTCANSTLREKCESGLVQSHVYNTPCHPQHTSRVPLSCPQRSLILRQLNLHDFILCKSQTALFPSLGFFYFNNRGQSLKFELDQDRVFEWVDITQTTISLRSLSGGRAFLEVGVEQKDLGGEGCK